LSLEEYRNVTSAVESMVITNYASEDTKNATLQVTKKLIFKTI